MRVRGKRYVVQGKERLIVLGSGRGDFIEGLGLGFKGYTGGNLLGKGGRGRFQVERILGVKVWRQGIFQEE